MAQERFRTDYRLWALLAGCVFIGLGFVDPVAGATWKGDNSLWAYVGILVSREYACSTDTALMLIGLRALLHAVPAALVGWVAQALVVVGWSSARSGPLASDGSPRGNRGRA